MPRAGTTAVVTLLRGNKLYAGWIGDSQAIIVRKGKPQQLVQPHKPDQEVDGFSCDMHFNTVGWETYVI